MRIQTRSHIRVSSGFDFTSNFFLVFFAEMFDHEVFGEYFSSGLAREDKTNDDDLKGEDGCYDDDVAVLLRDVDCDGSDSLGEGVCCHY